MFRILHTADWHLGQHFLHRDRLEEQDMAIQWLLEQIELQKPQACIIAGDIFDVTNPSNASMTLYYRFINALQSSDCRHLIVVGGNHDSPSRLNAPSEILKGMGVHVVGHATQNPEDQIIELRDTKGQIEAIIAAVPFLRDQDLRYGKLSGTESDRLDTIRNGIKTHYQTLSDAINKQYDTQKIPIIATGHLYVKGGSRAKDKKDRIHLGSIDSIEAEMFPGNFDYVALGHLHRPQMVDSQLPHIRYSGSLIPLSFSEIEDRKSIAWLEFDSGNWTKTELQEIPIFRRLIKIQAPILELLEKLQSLNIPERELASWIECIVETDQIIPDLEGQLRAATQGKNLEILKLRSTESIQGLDSFITEKELDELDVMEVFQERLKLVDAEDDKLEIYEQCFRELLSSMEQEDLMAE